jgi:crossover junction endodeoxyribonuclease RusA
MAPRGWLAGSAAQGRRPVKISLVVRGLPVPQGSARAFMAHGRAFVATEGNRTSSPLGAWRSSIASEARTAMGNRPVLEGPVFVTIELRMPRPKAHFHTPLHGSGIRETAPEWHAKKPDIDKLARSILDAITAVVIRDDAQVVGLYIEKRYELADEPVGATIGIREVKP